MDVERAVVSKVLNDRCYQRLVEAGVLLEHFQDDEHREAFGYLAGHYSNFGRSMTLTAFRQDMPSYKVLSTPEPVEWYIEKLKHRRRYGLLTEGIADATDAIEDDDVEEAQRVLNIALREAARESAVLLDHDITQEWQERFKRYQEWAEDRSMMRGIPTGYQSVDTTTRGLQPGNMVVITGPPGVGKTTLALSIGRHVHQEGFKVAFITFEMPYEELATRYDAMRAHVDHHRLLGGRLTEKDMSKLRTRMARDADNETFIMSEDINMATTVSGMQAKIHQHRPDLLIVDGVYMMRDEEGEPWGSPQGLTNISRGISRTCKLEKIPILITTQALLSKMRGNKVTLGSIGYSSAFAQDAHVAIGLYPDPDDRRQAVLDTMKSRNGPLISAMIEWNWREARFTEIMNDFDEDSDAEVSA